MCPGMGPNIDQLGSPWRKTVAGLVKCKCWWMSFEVK